MKRKFTKLTFTCLLLYFITFLDVAKASDKIFAHGFHSFKIGEVEYGFPSRLTHGRISLIQYSYPELVQKADSLSDDALESRLYRLLAKKKTITLYKVEQLLRNRFQWISFKALLRCHGASVIIILPSKYDVELEKNTECDEASATPFNDANLPSCQETDRRTCQDTLVKFESFLAGLKGPLCSLSFIENNETAERIYQQASVPVGYFGSFVYLNTTLRAPSPIDTFRNVNLLGTIGATSKDVNPKKLVICTHLDSFSPVQSYVANASDSSGIVMLLELMRLLARYPLEPNRQILFLLTTGTVNNYHGAYYFSNFYEQIDDVDMILCLDDLAGDDLYIQMSKNPKTGLPLQLHTSLLKEAGVKETLETIVTADTPMLNFQHEQFIKQKLYSITLTSVRDNVHPLFRTRTFRYRFDTNLLANRIANVARAIVGNCSSKPFKVNVKEIEESVKKWQERLLAPRCSCCNEMANDPIFQELEDHFNTFASDVQSQRFRTTVKGLTLYTANEAKCKVYKTRHTAYEVVMISSAIVYILIVWCGIRRSPKAVYEDFITVANYVAELNKAIANRGL